MAHPPVSIIYDEQLLTVVPAPPGIEQILTYTEKVLKVDPKHPYRGRQVHFAKVQLFSMLGVAPRILQTYAGLLDRVVAFCIQNGFEITRLHDDRPIFPEPRLDLMLGFRFKQRELLTQLLLARRSGMLLAPTRYGKTTLIKNTCRAFPGVMTIIAVPGIDLIRDLHRDLQESLPKREVKLMGGNTVKYPSDDITVVSMDSLHKINPSKPKLLLIDEPHAAVTNSRAPEIVKFSQARKYAFGATLTGRFDGRDMLLEGLVGPPLALRSYTEAVEEGAICPITVLMLKVKFADFYVKKRDKAYETLMFRSERMATLCRDLCRDLIPEDWQTLIFIKDEKQADMYLDFIGKTGVIAMAKKLKTPERKEMMRLMQENIVKRCLATRIYSQGVTFHDVRCLINVEGGGGSIGSIQKPGRLAEIRPDKKCGVVIDFIFECENATSDQMAWNNVIRDCWNRHKVYKDKGYDIHIVEGWNELKKKFEETAL